MQKNRKKYFDESRIEVVVFDKDVITSSSYGFDVEDGGIDFDNGNSSSESIGGDGYVS